MTRLKATGLTLAALAVTALCLTGFASSAGAAPVTMTFDNGRVSISALFQDKVILPATDQFPSDDLPLPQRTDVQLIGDLSGDQLSFTKALNTGLQFPYMHLIHPLDPTLKVPFTFRLNDPGLTGTYDAETGKVDLTGSLDVIVITGTGSAFPLPDSLDDLGVPPLGLLARCRVDDVPVSFTSSGQVPTTPFTGSAYKDGLSGNGALVASWTDLPDPVSENGGECDDLNPIIHGDGGLWLSTGLTEPDPIEEPEPTCETDPRLCPPPDFTEIDAVRVAPKKRTVRIGKKAKRVKLRVRVHNSGNVPATKTLVRIRSSNRRVKVRKQLRIDVPAAGWATATVVATVKKRARGRARITAASHGWSNAANLKIKQVKKKKVRKRR